MPSIPDPLGGPKEWLTRIASFPLKGISSHTEYSINESRYLPTNFKPPIRIFNKKNLFDDLACNKFPINYFSGHLCALCRATFCLKTFKHLSVATNYNLKHHDGRQLAVCAANGCNFCGMLMSFIPEEYRSLSHIRCILSWTDTGDCGRLVAQWDDGAANPVSYPLRVFSRGEEAIQRSSSSKGPTVTTSKEGRSFHFPNAPNIHDSNEIATKQMNSWLSTCLKYHRRCGGKEMPMLPTRVLDVDKKQLYVSKPGEVAQYAALSYCWGGPQRFQTTAGTLPAMKKNIPDVSMPKTLRDAVSITRKFGLRYLWIDSLCILQDDDSDMATEIDKMHQIYKKATIVIAAEIPSRVDDGFLHPRTLDGCITVPFAFSKDDAENISVYPEVGYRFPKEALTTRAWAFQETILPTRLLIFARGGIDWSCYSHYENSEKLDDVYDREGSLSRQTHKHRVTFRDRESSTLLGTATRRGFFWLKWQALLEEYVPLELTFVSDKLPALAGIAKEFQSMIDSRYVAGMWMKDLASQLGWYRPSNERSIQEREYHAPTWSWASVNGRVNVPSTYQPYEARTEVLVIACIIEPLHKEAPYGRVKNGVLEVDAYVLPVSRVPWTWFTTTVMDHDASFFDGDNQDGSIRCMILGYHTRHRWEGLFVKFLGDGTFQRIGFWKLGAPTINTMEAVSQPHQLQALRQRLTII